MPMRLQEDDVAGLSVAAQTAYKQEAAEYRREVAKIKRAAESERKAEVEAEEEIEPGAQVLIVDFQAPRTAYVERWDSVG